jgi:hypothetical protein
LSAEEIQALLGRTRQKGQYVELLNRFVESGEGGIDAKAEFVEIRDKQASTIKQGFDAAKDKKEAVDGAEKVKVIKSEENVYLVNLAAAGVEAPAEA